MNDFNYLYEGLQDGYETYRLYQTQQNNTMMSMMTYKTCFQFSKRFVHEVLDKKSCKSIKVFTMSQNNTLFSTLYLKNNILHNDNGNPSYIIHDTNDKSFHKPMYEFYFYYGKLHNTLGPAIKQHEPDYISLWFLFGESYEFNEWLKLSSLPDEEKIILRMTGPREISTKSLIYKHFLKGLVDDNE